LNEEGSAQAQENRGGKDDPSRFLLPTGQGPSALSFLFFGKDGLRAGWGLLLFWVIYEVLLGLVEGAILATPSRAAGLIRAAARPWSAANLITVEGIGFATVALATFVMSRIEGQPVGAYGFGGEKKIARFCSGFAWGLFFLLALIAGLWATGVLVFDGRVLSGASALRWGAIWLVGFLLVALLEESLVRGYAQYTLTRGLKGLYGMVPSTSDGAAGPKNAIGFWTAAALLSIYFGLGHAGNPGETPMGMISAGLIGLIFCLSLSRTGALWWALGFHAAWDWAQSFVFGVSDSGIMVEGHLLATHPAGKVLLSGGATGPEGSLFVLPILAVAALVVYWTLGRDKSREMRPN
jgi:membrane protease YdiL (CAAX protease family)